VKTKTKTKTLFVVLEAPRDQDLGLKDYITGINLLHILYTNSAVHQSYNKFSTLKVTHQKKTK